MSFNIGSVSADITADNSKFIKAFDQSGKAVGNLDKGLDNSQKAQKKFSASLTRISDFVIGGLLVKAVSTATTAVTNFAKETLLSGLDYKKMTDTIQAAGKVSDDVMKRLKKSTLDIGEQTTFSAGEVAAAYRMWQKNGRDLEEGLNGGIEAALKFAQITGSDLSQSVDFATDIMAIYGDRIDKNTDLTKLLVGTTEASKHSGSELAGVFRRTAVAAENFADPIENLGGLIAITDQNFDSAEEQGVALSGMLERFRTSVAQDELGKLGIATRDSNGDMRSYMDIIGDLDGEIAKLGGIKSQAAQDLLKTLFPDKKERKGAEATLKNLGNFQEKMQEIADTPVDELLKKTMGPLERLQSIFNTLQIRFTQLEVNGRPLIDLISDFIMKAGDLVIQLADNVLPIMKEVIEFLINNKDLVIAALVGIGGAILISVVPAIVGMVAAAAPAILLFGAIAGAIGLLYLAIKWMWENDFMGIQGVVGGIVEKAKELWGVLMENLVPALKEVWELIKELWGVIMDKLVPMLEGWLTVMVQLWDNFVSDISPALREFQDELQRLWDVIAPILIPILKDLKEVLIDTLEQVIENRIKPVLAFLQKAFEFILPHAVKFFNGALKGAKQMIGTLADWVSQKSEHIQSLFKNMFQMIGNLIGGDFKAAWENMKNIMKSIGDLDLFSLGKQLMQGFLNGIKSMGGAVMDAAKGIADSAKNAITSALNINSPSRFGIWVGQMTGDGLIGGLNQSESGVEKASEGLTDSLKSGIMQEAIATPTNNMQTINQSSNSTNNNTNNFNISGSQNPMNIAQIIDQRIAQSNRNSRLNSNQAYA
ncbi:MAG: phage tail tape measure protein [Fusobacteriaceae bacterium]